MAIDAMGGDHAPGTNVRGALWARSELGVDLTSVNDESLMRRELSKNGNRDNGIQIHHCSEVLAMDELPFRAL